MHKKNDKLFEIKIYDKIIDLIAREGYAIVGSRVSDILRSKRSLTLFNKQIRIARFFGMTRLAISICPASFQKLQPTKASVKTQWHSKVQLFMDELVASVLNKEVV